MTLSEFRAAVESGQIHEGGLINIHLPDGERPVVGWDCKYPEHGDMYKIARACTNHTIGSVSQKGIWSDCESGCWLWSYDCLSLVEDDPFEVSTEEDFLTLFGGE